MEDLTVQVAELLDEYNEEFDEAVNRAMFAVANEAAAILPTFLNDSPHLWLELSTSFSIPFSSDFTSLPSNFSLMTAEPTVAVLAIHISFRLFLF